MNYYSRKKTKTQRLRPFLITLLVLAVIGGAVFFVIYNRRPDIIQDCIYVEAGDTMPDAAALLKPGAEVPDEPIICSPSFDTIDTGKLAHYYINVTIGRFEYSSQVVIRDTAAPTGTLKAVTKMYGEKVEPEEFAESYDDVTKVFVRYGAPIDYTNIGDQEVTIELVDESRNVTKLTTTLTIIQDTTAPVIEGVNDIFAYTGESIAYKEGITVTDDYDKAPVLDVDVSAVKINEEGAYKIIYTATDASGNISQAAARVILKAPDPGIDNADKLGRLINDALNECLTDADSDYQVLYDIYWWIKKNMNFISHSDKSSEINAAITGFEQHHGDCYVYFAMLKKMMEACGFEVLEVERVGGESQHYWCLVKYKGSWYHIDACPRSSYHEKNWYCFLRTDEELRQETENIGDDYYNFDTTLYPRTPEEVLSISWRNGE